jgi:hypothetical protein
MPIDLVYFTPKVRCYRDGRVERLFKNEWRPCGTDTGNGYLKIEIKGKPLSCHRLIGFCFLGLDIENPKITIDHINRIGTDNRVENLRLATQQQQRWNTNPKGYRLTPSGTYISLIVVNGKQIYLGTYATTEEAHQKHLDAKAIYHVFD